MPTEEIRRQASLFKTGALQNAILNSANFSSIATDEEGVIQIFNIGALALSGRAAKGITVTKWLVKDVRGVDPA